jgi:DNA-directed RNA polymerase specialized sigma24 family protein
MNLMNQFDEQLHLESSGAPESMAIASSRRAQLKRAPETPPHRFREVLVFERYRACLQKEISPITSILFGPAMSSLSWAGRQLQSARTKDSARESVDEL